MFGLQIVHVLDDILKPVKIADARQQTAELVACIAYCRLMSLQDDRIADLQHSDYDSKLWIAHFRLQISGCSLKSLQTACLNL